jgi:uncharacterized membrane protein YcaP (DUF421 family)
MYLGLFLILRFILKRESGAVGMTDLLVIVLLADAAQNGMADNYHSVTDGLLLVLTIVSWSYALNWIGYRFPRISHIIHPEALPLIKDGQLLRHNMRKELITEDELRGMIREQGIEDFTVVRRAYLEGDGQLSVIKKDKQQHKHEENRNAT